MDGENGFVEQLRDVWIDALPLITHRIDDNFRWQVRMQGLEGTVRQASSFISLIAPEFLLTFRLVTFGSVSLV